MRAAYVTRFGPPEVLQIREQPKPEPREGEVLIRVRAIGLNFADVIARMGYYPDVPKPPFIPGLEASGVIERVGKGVKGRKVGDRVAAFTRQGAYAEFICVAAEATAALPKNMSFEEGAAIGVTYLSAYHGLVMLANLRGGEKVLQHASAGGVGTAAIQIAKLIGAEVFATAGSSSKLEVARKQGSDHVINYTDDDFREVVLRETGGYGVDVVMDSVGGRVFRKGYRLLAPMGRYVLYGLASVVGQRSISRMRALREIAAMRLLAPSTMVSKNVGLFGFNLYFLMHKVEYFRGVSRQLLRWYEEKKIKPFIGRVFPFDEIAAAQAYLQSRASVGKIVVTIPSRNKHS
jgi:NADPH:quinone reductase-like Zn-dependent oxidoreductase